MVLPLTRAHVLADVDNHKRDACIRELESLLGIRARAIYDQIAKVEAQRKLQKKGYQGIGLVIIGIIKT